MPILKCVFSSKTDAVLILVFIALVTPIWAETCVNCFTVDELVKMAVNHSPQIRSAEADVEASTFSAEAAGVWENPQLWASMGGRSVKSIRSSVIEYSIQQAIPIWGEKSVAKEALMAAAQSRGHQKQFLRQQVAFEIHSLSYSIASLREQRNYLVTRRSRLMLVKQYLKSRTFHSPPKITESLLIQNRLRGIDTEMAKVEVDLEELLQRLNFYTQLQTPPHPKLTWLQRPIAVAEDSLRDKLFQNNFQLRAQQAEVESAGKEVSLVRKSQLPDVSVLYAGFQEAGGDGEIYHRFGLGLSIPIDGIFGYKIDAAKARFGQEQVKERWVSDQVTSEFNQAWARFSETQKRVERYPLSMRDGLERDLRRAEGNFRNGLIETLLFLELESQTYDQFKNIYLAQSDHLRELSYLKMLTSEL